MAGRDREGDVFRESRRDWISDRATRRDEFDGGSRRSRDRSPIGRNRDRDDVWKSNLSREVWSGRSPDRRSRDLSRPPRASSDRDDRWESSLDRDRGRFDYDRTTSARSSPPLRSDSFTEEERALGGRRSRERDPEILGRERGRNMDRRSRERSTRNERNSFERNRSPSARDNEKSVDNWGRELRLGGERNRNGRPSPDRGSRRRSINRDRDSSRDRSRHRRSRERDWKRSVDDFLDGRNAGHSPNSKSGSRDKGRAESDKDWDSSNKRYERQRGRLPGTSKEESRDRLPSPNSRRSRDNKFYDRSRSKERTRDLSSQSRGRVESSPRRNKSCDRTPVVDEKSDGEDMVISDDDNNEEGSKLSTEDWESMLLGKYKRDNPQKTIVVRCMPTHVTEVDIHLDITSCNLVCHDIRLVRRKDTGFSRGFAFVEFYNIDDAVTWMEMKQGILKFGKAKCFMEYSVPRKNADAPAAPQKYLSDWICNKCQACNFSKRFLCYICNSSRTFCDVETWDVQASEHPTNTVVLIGLDVLTTEETVLKSIATLSNLPMRSVKIARDPFTNISKGACYLEMNNVLDAYHLFQSLKNDIPEIDGKRPDIKYARLDNNRPTSQAVSIMPKSATGSGKIGNTAIAAAQWSHQSAATSQIGEKYTLADVPRLAEYSATLYAKSRQEKIAYYSYYQNYFKKQITEGNPIDLPIDSDVGLETAQAALASSLVAAPALSVASLSEPPDGSGTKTYPMPDTSQYQYDPSSGFYYDPFTTLYYDANSQYYYNSKIGKYLYWDGTRHTYLPTPTTAELPEMSGADNKESSKAVIVGAPQPASKPEDKKKDNDPDRVKVAKRIAKDMEKWAKTLNQKKDSAKQAVAPSSAAPASTANRYGQTAGAADIGFAVLERKDHLSTLGNYFDSTSTTGRNDAPSTIFPSNVESEEEDEINEDVNHTDWERLICLLCKRQLGSKEALIKHQQISDLHKQNLAAWYQARGLDPNDAQTRKKQYRDRASERRQKYGLPDTPKPSRLKENYMKSRETSFEQPTTKGIGSDNLGNKLLQKMGWQEGMGLGKTNQGRTSIIEAKQRTATAGLGSRATGVTPGPGETYKDCVKKMMAARYAQLDD